MTVTDQGTDQGIDPAIDLAIDRGGAAPRLAIPPRHATELGLRAFLRTVRDNAIGTYTDAMFDQLVIPRRFLWQHSLIVNDPAGIKHVLLDNAANYHKTALARRLLEPGLGQGLLTSEDETWRRHRRIMAPSFDPRSVVGYAPIMTEVAEGLADAWDALPAGAELDVAAAMMHATLHVISRTMFSSDSGGIVDVVESGVERYQAEIRPTFLDLVGLPDWIPIPGRQAAAGRSLGAFDRAIDRLIADRTAHPGSGSRDLLARLIAARDEETGGGMTAKEVRDQVVTIFMAGHETTALALSWTWYLLAMHPAVEARLHAELDSVLGGRVPRHDDVAKLPYARMVIDEAMRLYPPAHSLSRTALADDEVSGHRVRRGSAVFILPWLVHRHRRLWQDPDRFDPERFTPERSASRPRFAYLPFGGGPRICIGAAFALTEAVLILATLARRYRLRLVPGHPVEPQGLITLRARHGIKVTLERRGGAGQA
jgi:cytochrome P450